MCENKLCKLEQGHKGSCQKIPPAPAKKPSRKKKGVGEGQPPAAAAAPVPPPPSPDDAASGTNLRPPEGVNPAELELIWTEKIAAAWRALRPKQQEFLIHYLRNGNAADAYRHAYNAQANAHTASALGAQAMATNGISAIMERLADQRTRALFVAQNTFFEMAEAKKDNFVYNVQTQKWENVGQTPDWNARDRGAHGLCKVFGTYAPEKVKHSGSVAITTKYKIPERRPIA